MQLLKPELMKKESLFLPLWLSRSQPRQSLAESIIRNSMSRISEVYSAVYVLFL